MSSRRPPKAWMGKRFKVTTPTAISGTGIDALLSVAEIDKKEKRRRWMKERYERNKLFKQRRLQERRVNREERKIQLQESRENDNLIAALTRFYVGSIVSSTESIDSVVSSMLTTNLVQDDANCVNSANEKIELIISELLHPDAIKRCIVKLEEHDQQLQVTELNPN